MGWTGSHRKIYYFITEVTVAANPQINKTLKLISSNSKIIDLGAGGRRITKKTITVDFIYTNNTDVISDIHCLPFKDDSVDAVFCTGVLEHITSPDTALSEIRRVLKKGGIIHLEVPFMQGYHADPKDYWRWTLDGLILFANCHSFKELRSGVHIGPSSTVLWILDEYVTIFFGRKYMGKWLSWLFRLFFFPLKYLDYFLVYRKDASVIASGIYFVGEKT